MKPSSVRKTKIVCTLGPAAEDTSTLEAMVKAGMNVARLNFSHGSHEEQARRVNAVKELRDRLNIPLALMIDTTGPDIRVGRFREHFIELKTGDTFLLAADDIEGTESGVTTTYKELASHVQPGETILLDDGQIRLRVKAIRNGDIECEVIVGGILSDNKSLHVPGRQLSIPYMRENDVEDIRFAINNGFDYIAASFVSDPADVLQIRAILEENNARHIRIISKIENAEGVKNADRILEVSDGIMVARGDMGVEMDYVEIPSIQKSLVKKAQIRGRISIVATQMLESMIQSPRPTRAEISDVANAIYDGASAIMLSGETAAGRYPIEAVTVMANIADRTEQDIDYRKRFSLLSLPSNQNITDAISYATVSTAHHLQAAAIVTPTQTGTTAMVISRYRPDCMIIACTPVKVVYHQLALSWGVTPTMMETAPTDEVLQYLAMKAVRETGLVQTGDVVVTTAGIPLGVAGTTNTIRIGTV